jgi:hypothetical protein
MSSATSSSPGSSTFTTFAADLCNALVLADIQRFKINSSEVSYFLPKYTQTDPPDEPALRKPCLARYYRETLIKIRVLCGKGNIWVSTGETTDASGRKVTNVTGVPTNGQMLSEKYFLLSRQKMSAVNRTITARVWNQEMQSVARWCDN